MAIKISSKIKMPSDFRRYRKFGGKRYNNVASKPTKQEARERADAWRSRGYSVRIAKVSGGYDIFIRKGK